MYLVCPLCAYNRPRASKWGDNSPFPGAIRLQGIRLPNSSSGGNSSSEFVFGGQFVFGEFVFAIRLRGGIRLRGAIRLRGIRLRNSSSGGNLSSGNSSSQFVFGGEFVFVEFVFGIRLRGGQFVFEEFVFGIRLRLRVERWYPHSGLNENIIKININCIITGIIVWAWYVICNMYCILWDSP